LTTKACIKKAAWIYVAAFLLLAFSFHAEAQTPEAKPSEAPVAEAKATKKAEKKSKSKGKAETDKKKKEEGKMTTVVMETSMGTMEIELNGEKAPISTKNFLKYVDDKFYDGLIFHRVIKNFMVQGGGFTEGMEQKKTHEQIKNEAGNGLKNEKYTLAMARTNVVDSATAQFFINVVDNDFLDHKDETPRGFGYAVFGKVTSGMDVVDKIKAVPTGFKSGMDDVPTTPVFIKSVKRK
jgi:cyclophilin family peptidyl-prolyl cis-trans isomerase